MASPGSAHRGSGVQLILAIDYCHKKNIVNRDIKLENTLLEANPRPNAKPLLKLCGAPSPAIPQMGQQLKLGVEG